MKMVVNYFDNCIDIYDDIVMCVEIENKKLFYRFIKDLNSDFCEDISFYFDNKEINMSNKINIYADYFNIDFNSKKITNDLNKYINSLITDDMYNDISKEYLKIRKIYNNILNNIDLSLEIEDELNLETFTKSMKISIKKVENILDNLLLLIDIEKIFNNNSILVFVNLKQYLSKNELIELYKYAIYNHVKIIIVDSQSYGCCLKYEKKLIIDDNLDEFVL